MKTLKLSAVAILIALASSANAQQYPGGYYAPTALQNPYQSAQAQYLMNPNSGIASSYVQQASCNSGSCGPAAGGYCSDGGCGLLGGGGGFGGESYPAGPGGGYMEQAMGGQHGPNGTGSCCLPRWFDVQADWLFWDRDFGGDSVGISSDGPQGPIVLGTSNLEIKDESGFRVTGAYMVAPATAIEASYFGGFNWASSATVNSNENLFSVFSQFGVDPPLNGGGASGGLPQTDFGRTHSLAFSSALDNGEINLRHRWVSANCLVHSSTMIGARYLRVAEEMTFNSDARFGSLDYVLQTDNDLVGAQIGGDFMICVSPRFKIGGDLDAGIYGTHSKQRTDANSTAISVGAVTTDSYAELASASDVAFVGEVGLNGLFQLTPRMTLRAGYQILYVAGVATAIDNFNTAIPLDASRRAFVDNDGEIFYHGANLGFEFAW